MRVNVKDRSLTYVTTPCIAKQMHYSDKEETASADNLAAIPSQSPRIGEANKKLTIMTKHSKFKQGECAEKVKRAVCVSTPTKCYNDEISFSNFE